MSKVSPYVFSIEPSFFASFSPICFVVSTNLSVNLVCIFSNCVPNLSKKEDKASVPLLPPLRSLNNCSRFPMSVVVSFLTSAGVPIFENPPVVSVIIDLACSLRFTTGVAERTPPIILFFIALKSFLMISVVCKDALCSSSNVAGCFFCSSINLSNSGCWSSANSFLVPSSRVTMYLPESLSNFAIFAKNCLSSSSAIFNPAAFTADSLLSNSAAANPILLISAALTPVCFSISLRVRTP